MADIEAPAGRLLAAMLAHQAIEPAVEPSGQIKICPVDREDECVIEHGPIEPVRDDQFDPGRLARAIGALLPFVDPGEAMPATFRRLADRGCDRRRLQAIERGLEPLIVA